VKKHSKIKREIIDTYIVFSNSDDSKNVIVVKDGNGKSRIIRANETLRNEYKRRKSEENSQNIKFSRYIEHSELTDISLNKRSINKEISLEEQVVSNLESERIIKEIWKLPTPSNGGKTRNLCKTMPKSSRHLFPEIFWDHACKKSFRNQWRDQTWY